MEDAAGTAVNRRSLSQELEAHRGDIDRLDAKLLLILAKRFSATRRVGEIKRALGLPPIDPDREAQQRERVRVLAQVYAVDERLALALLHLVIDRVVLEHSAPT